jgi:hypothetical protein
MNRFDLNLCFFRLIGSVSISLAQPRPASNEQTQEQLSPEVVITDPCIQIGTLPIKFGQNRARSDSISTNLNNEGQSISSESVLLHLEDNQRGF